MEGPKKLNTQTCTQQMYNTNVLQNCTNKIYKSNVQTKYTKNCTDEMYIAFVYFLRYFFGFTLYVQNKVVQKTYQINERFFVRLCFVHIR